MSERHQDEFVKSSSIRVCQEENETDDEGHAATL